jgi:DNA-binding transcriptional LysR family regulator
MLAAAPAYAAAEDLRGGRVVTLLTKYEPEPATLYAVYPHAGHLASKARDRDHSALTISQSADTSASVGLFSASLRR